MTVRIKNIILYDRLGAVAGYLEIRPQTDRTHLRLKQNLAQSGLLLSLVIDGVNKVCKINGVLTEYDLPGAVDLNYEIFVCIVQQVGANIVSLASGALNLNKLKSRTAVQEIDHAIKKICSVDAQGQGLCEQCPYREYFFKQA